MNEQQCPHCLGTYKRLSQHLITSDCASVYTAQGQAANGCAGSQTSVVIPETSFPACSPLNCNASFTNISSSNCSSNTLLDCENQEFAMGSTSIFERNFTPEEFLMVKLTKVCNDANVPLHLVDSIVDVFQQASANGLDLASHHIRSRKYFLEHLSRKFITPTPHTVLVSIEATQQHNKASGNVMETIPLTRYSFLDQAKDLISDHDLWGNLENFKGVISSNPKNYFTAEPTSDNGMVDEVTSGEWYRKTYKQCSKLAGQEKFLILGVICYCDKTGTDVNQRNPLEPFTFTFTIFNRKCRYKTNAWRLLGFIPNFEAKSNASKSYGRSSAVGRGRSTRNYHRCLYNLLQPLIQNQGIVDPIYMNVRIGDLVERCRIFFPLAFVIGDALSSDRMCGRYQAYSVPRMCRACDVPYSECDNTEYQCTYFKMKNLQKVATEALKLYGLEPYSSQDSIPHRKDVPMLQRQARDRMMKLSTHIHSNAFKEVWFGANKYGILKATPHDMMHAFCHGVVVYVVRILIAPLTPAEKHRLDAMIEGVLVPLHSSQKNKYPRCNFSKGITNLTLLTAAEWIGVVFALSLITISKEGTNLWLDVKQRTAPVGIVETQRGKRLTYHVENKTCGLEEELPSGVICEPTDILYLLEMLLSFHAWYKNGHPFSISSQESVAEVEDAIRIMLQSVKELTPRNHGNGWKLQKFHELLHLAKDIWYYGSPNNWDTSPGEHALINFAKRPAKRSHKKHSSFLDQVNSRLHESAIIEKADLALSQSVDETQRTHDKVSHNLQDAQGTSDFISTTLPTFTVDLTTSKENSNTAVQWEGKSYLQGAVVLNLFVVDWFLHNNMNPSTPLHGQHSASIYTEYKHYGDIMRAHPNYRSDGPWYDWVMVALEGQASSSKRKQGRNIQGHWDIKFIPAKVLCFFQVDSYTNSTFALIHPCRRSKHSGDSILFERWQLEYKQSSTTSNQSKMVPFLQYVNVNSFGDSVLVIEDEPGIFPLHSYACPVVSVVLPYESSWSSKFLNTE